MGENSKIEWTDHTFNPWIGCAKVSPGCQNCYAETLMDTRMGRARWGPDGTRVRTSVAYWRQPLKWDRDAAKAGRRARVFCGSVCDVFENRPELREWRSDLFELICKTHNLNWLLLTKRPENFMRLWPSFLPAPNIWAGATVENQAMADLRIHYLRKVPARVRFLSVEPMIGPIHFCDLWLTGRPSLVQAINLEPQDNLGPWLKIDWVIVGGESGPNARPMHPNWVRSIRDQCQEANVPLFFKGWGEWLPASQILSGDGKVFGWVNCEAKTMDVDGESFYQVGSSHSGHLLDGREWREFPEVK